MDLRLEKVQPAELTERDLYWLRRSCRRMYTGVEPKHIIEHTLQGHMTLWRPVHAEIEGMIALQILNNPSGKELLVYTMAGKGFLENLEEIADLLRLYARQCGCRYFSGNVTSEALMAIYLKKMPGAQLASYSMVEELDG